MIDVAGWPLIRRTAWPRNVLYSEVWGSKDGEAWTMLGVERAYV